MSEAKDPAIKLFGKTIQLLLPDDVVLDKANEQQSYCSGDTKKTSDKEHATTQTNNTYSHQDPSTSSGIDDDPKTPTPEKETSSKNTQKKENPNANNEEKPQKPDKILPCPRCNSMDTKFCYYNNYNVNQPRHFCKNCQRYWTAGGTMRNTPVGSGRRKNKSASSASYYRQLVVSEALQRPHKTNGSVLNFCSDFTLCESMNLALNFSNKSQKSEDDHSSSASNSAEKGVNNNGLKNFQGYPLQIPCVPVPPWSYPWNPAQFGPPIMPLVPPTNLGPADYPVSIYQTPQCWGTPWGMSWVTPQNDQISSTSPLGKHSRDGNLLSPSSRSGTEEFSRDIKDSESGVLFPKTLRINNPNEAAKSSLWSTLGISKDEHNNSNDNNNLYKAFKSKGDEKNELAENSLVNLQANPAALSRSLNFHETS